jgi:hypothetical protein
MAFLYVLDVPEFAPLIAAAAGGSAAVTLKGDYAQLSQAGALVLRRDVSGLGLAVWFGALTGGYRGRVECFDEHELRIVDE